MGQLEPISWVGLSWLGWPLFGFGWSWIVPIFPPIRSAFPGSIVSLDTCLGSSGSSWCSISDFCLQTSSVHSVHCTPPLQGCASSPDRKKTRERLHISVCVPSLCRPLQCSTTEQHIPQPSPMKNNITKLIFSTAQMLNYFDFVLKPKRGAKKMIKNKSAKEDFNNL